MTAQPKEKNADAKYNGNAFITKLKQKEASVVEEVVHRYTAELFNAGLGLGFDADQAKELVQDVWAAFFVAVERFRADSKLRTFLFGILYNKASEFRRKKKKDNLHDSIDDVLDQRFASDGQWVRPPLDPERFLAASETLEIIERCMDTLPVQQRMAFFLKEVKEYSTNEICNILGLSGTNLGVTLFRARNRLRECVESKVGSEDL